MTSAVSLSLAVLIGSIAYAGWALREIAAGANGLWFIAGLPIAALAIPTLLTAWWFTLAWIYRAPRPADVRIPVSRLPGLFWQEMLAIAWSVPRMILYRVLLRDPPSVPASNPVLLLHGVLCNAGVWVPVVRDLAARGIGPVYTLSYGPPLASIDLFANQASSKIDAILAATGASQVIVVGHSMGGLVARACARRHGGARIRRIITLGTPHHGSVLAYLFFGVSLSQLRPRSAWLLKLGEKVADGDPPVTSIWSWHDSMVAPQTSSVLDGARNEALIGIGHNALLGAAEVHQRLAQEIVDAGHGSTGVASRDPKGSRRRRA